MTDEIEIEEHDLLDDPTVRNVFPDISRLKQEILDYDYKEGTESKDHNPTTSSSDIHESNNAESLENDVETNLIVPPGNIQNFFPNRQHDDFTRGDKGIEMKICKNKIILGSKPISPVCSKSEDFERNIKPYCAVVALEDFGCYLRRSLRYCNMCKILFPTNLDYSNHKNNFHIEQLTDTENVEVKVNLKSDEDKIDQQKYKENKVRSGEEIQQKSDQMLTKLDRENAKCPICKKLLKYKRNLKVHLMQVHKMTEQTTLETLQKKPRPQPREEITAVLKRNECFHCKKLFRSQSLLIEHIYSILQNTKNDPKQNSNKILIGKKTNNEQKINVVPENGNKNLTDIEKSKFSKNQRVNLKTVQQSKTFYICQFCFIYFKTTKIYLRHMTIKHKMVKNVQMTKVDFDPKCKHCPRVSEDVDMYNSHLRKRHPKIIQEAIVLSRKQLLCRSNKVRIPVVSEDRTSYYTCDYCSLYFNTTKRLVGHMAVKHKVINVPKLSKIVFDPRCKYCNRTYSTAKHYNKHLQRTHSAKCNQSYEKCNSTITDDMNKNKQNLSDMKYYKCNFCGLYFKTMKFYSRHLSLKHKITNIPKAKKEEFNANCRYCSKTSNSIIRYNAHMYKHHSAYLNHAAVKSTALKYNVKKVVITKPKILKVHNSNKAERQHQTEIQCFKCYFCPLFFMSMRYYAKHIRVKHKLNVIPKVKKVTYNPKCRFCPKHLNTAKLYNKHMNMRHYTELSKFYEENKNDEHINVQNNVKTAPISQVNRSDEKQSEVKRFYRCCYCSYYFNSLNICNSHIVRKHKVESVRELKKIEFDPNCKYCPLESVDEIAYNRHLHSCHWKRVNENFTKRFKHSRPKSLEKNTEDKSVTEHKNKTQDVPKPMDENSHIIPIIKSALFKCHKCDIHFLNIKSAMDHSNHMEMLVNWKCLVCNRIFKDCDKGLHEKQHLFSDIFTVYDLNTANISNILYKCSKCDLHYDESVDNHHHECVLNLRQCYTCEICKISMDCNAKICHEYNHKHRHLTPIDFIIIETDVLYDDSSNLQMKLNKNNLNNVHNKADQVEYGISKLKNSLKRKIENIETLDTKKKLKSDKIAECSNNGSKDIFDGNYSFEVGSHQRKYDSMLLKLSFCDTCKSFVSIIGQRRKEHAQGLCEKLPTLVCKDCGLRLSCKMLSTHKQLHKRIKNLQLQHFKFYAFNSGKRALPPMPQYEKCKICDVNFISKSTLGQHVCSDNDYKICDICNIKLFKEIFHLHMAFHKYNMDESSSNLKSNNTVACKKLPEMNSQEENVLFILYGCKVCDVYVDTYDRLIEHCQNHCLNNLPTYTEECKVCNITLEDSSLKTHIKAHEKFGVPSYDKLNFDPFYFRFDNKVWLNHVFGSHPKFKELDIIQRSPYRYEHRFKMNILQEGRFDLTLYKCDKCKRYVEPDVIFHHIENSCSNLRKHTCPICHLDFISTFSLTRHKKTHEDPKVTFKSYRIVQFNRQDDAKLNETFFGPPQFYVLHQCRNCNGVVDRSHRMAHVCHENGLKSCMECGLLITADIYENHITKHKTLDSFISENMKVILFGEQELNNKKIDSTSVSTFRGKIHDYSFYTCRNCHVCVKDRKSTLNHMCCSKGSRIACSKCGLYFYAYRLLSHTKNHESDPDFVLDNMSFIEFNPSLPQPEDDFKSSDEMIGQECAVGVDANENDEIKSDVVQNTSQGNSLPTALDHNNLIEGENTANIYNCTCCGLHFLDKPAIVEHMSQCEPKAKQAKQNCSKCGLLFTPNVLFKHLLTHHGDREINYKFNIVSESKLSS